MEKPAAVDAPGIRAIMEAGKKAKSLGLAIVAGTQRRHHNKYVETIRRIRDGACGEITAARAYWCGGPIGFYERKPEYSDVEYQLRCWYHFLWLSGDHIVEQHVHNLDVINWAMGMHPVKAFGYGGRAWQIHGDIWDHHTVDFEFENGVHLSSMCRQIPNCVDNVSEFVVGTKASSNCADWIRGKGMEWKFEGEAQNPYVQEHADLIESIRKGQPLNEAQNVAESTMTAIMGRMAEYSGQVVTWDEALKSEEKLRPEKIELGPMPPRPIAVPGGKEYAGEGWMPG
jgi:predicted dehydrogenase